MSRGRDNSRCIHTDNSVTIRIATEEDSIRIATEEDSIRIATEDDSNWIADAFVSALKFMTHPFT